MTTLKLFNKGNQVSNPLTVTWKKTLSPKKMQTIVPLML